MARKKAEIALQQELETQEEWEEYLAKEGLSVIDVYQEWAGPCKAMISFLKRLKNELGDDLLRFAVAKTDTIDALERYRGKCEPLFMLYAGGCLVAILRGANSPLLLRTITEQLAYEHKVIDGAAERKEIKDPQLADLDKEKAAQDEEETEKEEEIEQEVTVCIIKPDAIAAGKKDEILEQLAERGIEVLTDEERQLTEEEVKEFYSSHADEDYFEDLVKFMSSGPSHVLVLAKGDAGIIDEFRDLLGPKDVEEAKEVAPECLRAKYGSEKLTNALHASDSKDRAHAELAFFFPNFSMPTRTVVKPQKAKKEKKKKGKKQKAPKIERTLALIRPDAAANHKEEILAKVKEAGFEVALQKEIQLTKEQAEEFYKEHKGEDYFEELTTRMSSGPLLALGLARVEAVSSWRDMLGPKEVPVAKTDAPQSLRAQFSVDEDLINPLHGSDSASKAEEELDFFFPVEQTMAVVKPDAYQTKEDIMNKIREAGFRIAARQETELNNDIVEALYSEHKDKEYFNDLSDHMTSGPTLFMVLSRHDAVEGWRSLMGNTDPEKAKEENPESIRATFGKDIKANAVHGATTAEAAKAEVKLVFGDIEFNKDGTVKGEETGLENETVEEEAEDEEEDEEEEEDEDEEKEKASGDEGEAEAGEEAQDQAAEQEEGGEQGEERPASSASAKGDQEPAAEGEQQKEEGEEAAERPSSQASQKADEEQKAEGEGEAEEGQQQEGEEAPKLEGEEEEKEKGDEQEQEKEDKGEEGGQAEQEDERTESAAKSRPQTGEGKEQPGSGEKSSEGDKESPEGGKKSPEGGKDGKESPEGGKKSPEGGKDDDKKSTEDGKQSPEAGKKSPEGERSATPGKAGTRPPTGERPASKAASTKEEEQKEDKKEEEAAEQKKDSRPPSAEKAESVKEDDQKEDKGEGEAEDKKEEAQEEKQEEAKEEEKAEEQQAEASEEQTEEKTEEKTEETSEEKTEEKTEENTEEKTEEKVEQTEEKQEEQTEEKQEEQTEEKGAEEAEQTEEKKEDAASTKGEDAGEASDDKKDEEDKKDDDKKEEEAAKKDD